MGIFGNRQVLSLLSRILTSLKDQNAGTVGVGEVNDTIMGGVQCLNSILLHPNSDSVELKKRKIRAKMSIVDIII